MPGRVGIIQISHRGPSDDVDHDYWTAGRGAQLSAMYCDLLGMEPIYIGYHKAIHPDGRTPELGFEHSPEDAPPVWGDPARPAQVHLDVRVDDVDRASDLVVAQGAAVLESFEDHVVLADPAGHPFCLWPGGGVVGRIARIVFDTPDPGGLAVFYGALLRGREQGVELAFQRSYGPAPTWPDPTHPAQLHLDIGFDEPDAPSVSDFIGGLGGQRRPLPERGPDHLVFLDPSGHPFCVGVGGWGTHGPAQVAEYQAWLSEHPEEA